MPAVPLPHREALLGLTNQSSPRSKLLQMRSLVQAIPTARDIDMDFSVWKMSYRWRVTRSSVYSYIGLFGPAPDGWSLPKTLMNLTDSSRLENYSQRDHCTVRSHVRTICIRCAAT